MAGEVLYHNIKLHLHHGVDKRGESDDDGWASLLEHDKVKRAKGPPAKTQSLDFKFKNDKALVMIT